MQNSLDELQKAENAYQLSVKPKGPTVKPDGTKTQPPVTPIKVINTVPVTMRSLTGNRTYTFRNEEEIDEFVENIRKNLKEKLEKNTVIKLN